MLHRRHTITVATSALLFLCVVLHAQTNSRLQRSVPCNGGGWQSLLDRGLDSAHSYIDLSPVAFNADRTFAVVSMGHHCGPRCDGGTFYVLEKKEGVWKNLRWNGTSCAWAS